MPFAFFFFFLLFFLPLRLWGDAAAGPVGVFSEEVRGRLGERAGGGDVRRKEKLSRRRTGRRGARCPSFPRVTVIAGRRDRVAISDGEDCGGGGGSSGRARGRGVSRVPPANFLVCYASFPSLLSLTYSSLFNYFSSEDVFLFFYFYFFSLIKAAFLSPKLYLGGPAGTSAHGHFKPFSLHVCIIANFPQVDGSQVRLREGSEKTFCLLETS